MRATEPPGNCPFCPRLAVVREANRVKYSHWHNAPVANFGDLDARLLIVGLAPGLHGANRTGRPFTGDWAGDLLYSTLLRWGLARGVYRENADDGLALVDTLITNAVRCVPPQNKPTPTEVATCRGFLSATMNAMPKLEAIVALGRVSHESILRAFAVRLASYPFAHGAKHRMSTPAGRHVALFDSYHCSRYNTSTRVLTVDMFHSVFENVSARLAGCA